MHTLWGKWAPPLERSLLASITYAGTIICVLSGSAFNTTHLHLSTSSVYVNFYYVKYWFGILLLTGSLTGSLVIFPIAGLLCEYGFDGKGFDGGWPSIFYIFG